MPSRRSYLAALATVVAGCSADPGSPSTDAPTETADDSPTPAPTATPHSTPTTTSSDEVEPLPADDPALAWAVRLPEPIQSTPTVGPGGDRVYVGAGDRSFEGTSEVDETASGVLFALGAGDGVESWRAPTDAPIVDGPVVHDGRIYAATGYSNGFYGVDNRVVAYGSDGTRRWTTGPRRKFLSIVAAHDGTVYVGTSDDALSTTGENVFAVGSDGDVRWTQGSGDVGAATVADESLLCGWAGRELASLDLATGAVEWQVAGESLGNPAAAVTTVEGHCFTQPRTRTDEGYPIVARSLADGSEQWRYSIAPEDGGNFVPSGVAALRPSSDDGDESSGLVATEYGGTVFALDLDGTERWTFAADAKIGSPVVGDAVYVGDVDGTVYSLDTRDGSVRWRASFAQYPKVRPLAEGVLAFTSRDGESVLVSIDAAGDERWRFSTSKRLGGAAVAGERVYAGTNDGTLFALGA